MGIVGFHMAECDNKNNIRNKGFHWMYDIPGYPLTICDLTLGFKTMGWKKPPGMSRESL